jgi:tRNA(adenine34) deaminase
MDMRSCSSGRTLKVVFYAIAIFSFAVFPYTFADENKISWLAELDEIEKRVNSYVPDPRYSDDLFILVTIREALAGSRENNGGIGACLVREATGEIVEKGHNRQYEPYFRSDLHAEMDLLTRYEERVKAQQFQTSSFGDPRKVGGLVLYCSVEPCPMCLTRIH